jgi:undecaprenyl-diphosphatase
MQQAPLFGMAVAVAVGTVPAALAGLAFRSGIERAFGADLRLPGALMMATGLVLLLSRAAPPGSSSRVGPGRGFLIGLAQAMALLPGLSRSGLTIVAGYFLRLDRKLAARFSFLLAVPALLGASGLQIVETLRAGAPGSGGPAGLEAAEMAGLLCGTLVSAAVGTACLLLVLETIQKGALHWFAAYCLPAGGVLVAAGFLS